jgi:hypothetical protein
VSSVVTLLVISGLGAALSFQVGSAGEQVTGVQTSTQFLTHWQFEGSATGATPRIVPRAWSTVVGTPTRLALRSASALVDVGRPGDSAAEWTINETAGIPASTELELHLSVTYLLGAGTRTFATTVYVETNARALLAPLTFTVYWDSGGRAAVVLQSQLVLSQVCSAVGVCP